MTTHWTTPAKVSPVLTEHHYLGPTKRGFAWADSRGVIVLATPTSRRLPLNWLELTRWCITTQERNAGSKQWGSMIRALRARCPDVTTIVSYSDPSVGHTGALYRACNWWWAPTWHRLRPPPTGNGAWTDSGVQSVKDRWVYAVRPDPLRSAALVAKDEAVLRKMPFARYIEPGGADYRSWVTLQEFEALA